ncbi:MAG: COX15/CtaA family protein [Gammaproteobacteria bacterium]|nr:COX15/CtaA family protein [Gammaproteobacteria bacterium]
MLWFRPLALAAAVLTLAVVVLGAWVRLNDAGLGCPDWPGCYGQVTVPQTAAELEAAQAAFPDRPPEPGKAWLEMTHRYAAGILGLLILAIAVIAWRRRDDPEQRVFLPVFLVALVIFQALLGMWTVTLLLKPILVVLHLLGGMTTLALLWWLYLSTDPKRPPRALAAPPLGMAAVAGLIMLGLQIALGGWTSANYAALACPDFPTCQAEWWPEMDFADGFVLWRGTGIDYEGGVLDNDARVAVHMTHRVGAIVTALVLFAIGGTAVWRARTRGARAAGAWLIVLVCLQWAIAVSMLARGLPVMLATAHNAIAAILVLTLVYLIYKSWRMQPTPGR